MKASNYAVGGARAVANYPCRFNLPAQVDAYVAHFGQTSAETLVVIEIGGNDVRDALAAALSGQDPSSYIQNAILSLSANIIRLYCHGAKQFLILKVPDIGKTPAVRALDHQFPGFGIADLANTLSQAYNNGLEAAVHGLPALAPGIDVKTLDVYATLNAIVADPGTYGFANVTDACITPNQPPFSCAKPDTYVFWDGIHPTKALHAIVAQQAIDAIFAP
jgi:phospholipase/lecithinase/hemolysin